MSGTDGSTGGSGWAAPQPVRHAYRLVERDASLTAAVGLMQQSLPYAVARFGVLFGASVVGIVWLTIMIGGGAWLSDHIAHAFGVVWVLFCLVGAGFVWGTLLRYALHLIDCGHVAVLTELITQGRVGNGAESMFAYGRRVVTARFGQVNLLFGLNALVRGVLQAFHRTLDWLGELLPIPGLDGLARLLDIVLGAATRYLDKVIFSYTLARGDGDPWQISREGVVYYCQNAKPILGTAVRVVIFEYVLTALLWVLLLAPAGLVTLALPHAVRESGGGGDAGDRRPAGRQPARGLHQAVVPDHDDGALPHRHRGPADQRRVGCQAGRNFRQVPHPGATGLAIDPPGVK